MRHQATKAVGAALALLTAGGCYSGFEWGGAAPGPGAGTGGDSGEGVDSEAGPGEGDGASDGSGGDDGPAAVSCDALSIGGSQVRRLTGLEYERTVSDLLGISADVARRLPPENRARGFDNQAEVQDVTPDHVLSWQGVAESLTAEAMPNVGEFVGCDVGGPEADACFAQFVADFGRRAFRRPLSADEVESYTAFFEGQRMESGPERAVELLVQAMLMSPKFLYLLEPGVEGEPTALDDYAIASRMSYLMWNTMPDEELFAAADAGELSSVEGIEAQARRMVADPRAQEVIRDFYLQWADAYSLESLNLPEGFETSLVTAAEEEIERFVADWYEGGGRLSELLTSSKAFVNGELARYYGLEGVEGPELQELTLNPETHGGLLTRAAFVGTHTIPPSRGDFVLNRLLCITLTVPPLDIPEPPEGEEYETRRERFEAHAEMECARGCHGMIDPLGFAFEHYDGSGRWRATDNDHPIDAATEVAVSSAPELSGPVDGAMELSERLASSESVLSCHASQWFTYAYNRPPTQEDACVEQRLADAFIEADGQVEQMLINLTLSDSFRYVLKQPLAR